MIPGADAAIDGVVRAPRPGRAEPRRRARPDPHELDRSTSATSLPTVQCPTLVLHRTGDRDSRRRGGPLHRRAASRARASSSCPGDDHVPWVGMDDIARRGRGVPHRRPPGAASRTACWRRSSSPTSSARPTARAALGDAAWAALLDAHHAARAARARALRRRRGRHGGRRLPRALRRPGARDPARARDPRVAAAARARRARRRAHRRGRARRRAARAGSPCTSAARVVAAAGAGEVLVTQTTHDLVEGSGLEFDDRGEHELKGIETRAAALRRALTSAPRA